MTPNGRALLVADHAAGTLVGIDVGTRQIIGSLSLGGHPAAIAITNDGDADDTDETAFVTEFFAELVSDFLADAPTQLESLRETATSGDAIGARRAAHTLKGNSRTFGAGHLASLCQDAEAAAGAGDLDRVLSRLDAIGRGWGRVRAELVALRDGSA